MLIKIKMGGPYNMHKIFLQSIVGNILVYNFLSCITGSSPVTMDTLQMIYGKIMYYADTKILSYVARIKFGF